MNGDRPMERFRPVAIALIALSVLAAVGVVIGWGLAVRFADPGTTATSATVSTLLHVSSADASTEPAFARSSGDAVAIVEMVAPAVVTVLNGSVADPMATDASGTGFIVTNEGHIITNYHVIEGGSTFSVVLSNGEERSATLVGGDPDTDLAIMRIDGGVPGVVVFGNSDIVRPGEPVLAIGSPLGTYSNTVTRGIVSGIDRTVSAGDDRPLLQDLIQHDASINPGNSGGPLFNFRGEVIGVNTLGIEQSSAGDLAQGLFFAIPSNTVTQIATLLLEGRETESVSLGIETAWLTADLREWVSVGLR